MTTEKNEIPKKTWRDHCGMSSVTHIAITKETKLRINKLKRETKFRNMDEFINHLIELRLMELVRQDYPEEETVSI